MMKLFAKKPCSFNGKKFFIGNEIPLEYVLDPKAQENMGILVVVEGTPETGESAETASDAGGPLLPPVSTSEEKGEETIYSKYKLSRMNKKELLAVAAEKGVEVADDLTNDKIVELILERQG